MAPAVATYEPHDPSRTVLYHVIAEHLETFLASLDADPDAPGLPAYVQREFYAYLRCGRRIGKLNGIFAPVSAGAPRRRPHHLDAAAPLGPATCACRSARWRGLGAVSR